MVGKYDSKSQLDPDLGTVCIQRVGAQTWVQVPPCVGKETVADKGLPENAESKSNEHSTPNPN